MSRGDPAWCVSPPPPPPTGGQAGLTPTPSVPVHSPPTQQTQNSSSK